MRGMRLVWLLLVAGALHAAPSAGQAAKAKLQNRSVTTGKSGKKLRAAPSRRADGVRFAGEPISLDIKDADLRDVLHTFSQLTGLNIVVDPEVKGSVTVRLHDVPWDQALDVIVRTNGFGYILEGNVLRVGTVSKLSAAPPLE